MEKLGVEFSKNSIQTIGHMKIGALASVIGDTDPNICEHPSHSLISAGEGQAFCNLCESYVKIKQ